MVILFCKGDRKTDVRVALKKELKAQAIKLREHPTFLVFRQLGRQEKLQVGGMAIMIAHLYAFALHPGSAVGRRKP